MRKTTMMIAATALGLATVGGTAIAEPIEVDPKLHDYKKVSGISGNLNSIGSDTLNNLMTLWAEGFRKKYPSVRIQIEGKGSSTAPPALIEGTAQLGPMSRPMKAQEINKFEQKYGFKPSRVAVALDALAVYVNKDNPIEGLTIPQIDAIFSKTRKCGHPEEIHVWGQVDLTGTWTNLPISLYGRNSASGTYGYFKKHALCKGDFRNSVKEQPGSASVVNGVAGDRSGIGYSGIGYRTSGVRTVPLAKKDGQPYHSPSYGDVLSGKYPLGRQLYVYYVKAPNKPVDPLIREFLKFVLSKEGQQVVVKDGYLPLPAKVAEKLLAHLK